MPSVINSDDGVSSGTAGLKTSGSNDGITVFQQNGTESMRIDASGNITVKDRIQFGIDAQTNIQAGGTSDVDLIVAADTNLRFETATNEQMRIDSSGNVGIGTSSPPAKFAVSNGGAAGFEFNPTGGVSGGTYTQSFNRSTSAYVATTNYAATHTWYVSSTRAMDIDSSGRLLINTTTADTNYRVRIDGNIASSSPLRCTMDSTSSVTQVGFFNPNGVVGSISTSGTSTAYNTSSDYRLKENIQPMTGALAKVAALKPCTYKWKSDGSDGEGFIAHELAEVVPQCVTGEKDATRMEQYEISAAVPATYDEEGNELTPAIAAVMGEREMPVYQGIDTSFLVATLTAAIQELKAELDATKAEVAALKARTT